MLTGTGREVANPDDRHSGIAVTDQLRAPSVDPALIAALRGRFVDVGYSEEGIRNACSTGMSQDPWSLATGQPPRDGSPFSTIFTLFWSAAPVEAGQLEAALEPLRLSDVEKLGLIEVRDGLAHPLCVIRPLDDLMVASDVPALHADRVLGVVPASETLARLTVRQPVKRALDLGTGCGVQGLLLARHSETVISIDVNPRALAFAAFNAALNETTNVQCLEGSWFAPVDNDRFDTIACNPPYVISPDAAYTYRDGGLPRDAVSRMVVREAARHLADGGFATILCNWIHDDSWSDPVRSWVADTGCDAVLLHYATVEPASYAARWNIELQSRAPKTFEATVRRWLDYYRAEGITRIGLGGVILRRRSAGTNWVRTLDMSTGPSRTSGDHVRRLFTAADFLESVNDRQLLTYAFKLVDGHRVDQTLAYPSEKYVVGPAIYRHLAGIGVEAQIDPRALEVLLECDGQRTLGALASETAERRGETVDAVAELVESPVRQLVERGFIIPIVEGRN
jgi:methylase of polypeptide subunit release factors